MALSTYDELKAAILDWLARTEDDEDSVVARVPDFITLAESRFNRELRVRELIERVEAPINEAQETMPARFLEPISASLIMPDGVVRPLKYVTAHELSRGARNADGDPFLYSIVGGMILFGPKIEFDEDADPDTIPKMEMIGYFKQAALSDDNETNDILRFYPNVYLYASLLEASAFIVSDQTGGWADLYEDAVRKANETSEYTMDSVTREPPPSYLVV